VTYCEYFVATLQRAQVALIAGRPGDRGVPRRHLSEWSPIAGYVAPFLLAAFGCALYSYHLAPRPRGAAPIVEMVVLLGVGAVLVEPAVRVLSM